MATLSRRIRVSALKKAPTRFRLEQRKGVDWLVTPDGQETWSFGVCCVEPGEKFEEYDTAKPAYAGFRYYPDGASWASDAVKRLQQWGFNTIGAWSATDLLRKPQAPNLYFTPILHMGSGAGAPWKDMWDPVTVGLMDQIARDQILPLKGEKRVIGYFSDNEMGWWNAAMFDWSWKGPRSRVRLTAFLKGRYRGSWRALLRDFVPRAASSFAGLEKKGQLYLRPGGQGVHAVQAWMRILADRYYSLCRTIIKKYDPGALYLGDRYISNFYPEIAEEAGKYVDILSTNLNADWNDGTFARFYLPTLERRCRKPVMITEYYEAARDSRSHNRNDSSGFPVVDTQAERAQGFLNQTRTFLDTPYVVGAHWFQYYDEPTFGRGDGENYNMGLVDIDNRPYEELTQASQNLDLIAEHAESPHARTPQRPGAYQRGDTSTPPYRNNLTIPPLPKSAVTDLNKWPRANAFVAPLGQAERGDLYIAWRTDGLYVATYWVESRFDEAYYVDGKVPASEHARLKLTLNGHRYDIDLETSPIAVARILGVRSTAILRLPPAKISIDLDATLTTGSHAYTLRWRGHYALSK